MASSIFYPRTKRNCFTLESRRVGPEISPEAPAPRREETEGLERQNAESYRALSARILELQDVERRKIARELHDSVGQYLVGLKLSLGELQAGKSLAISDNPALLSETIDPMDRAIREVRTLSHLLHPPLLDELGLDSAVRWYVEGFSGRWQ